LEKKGEKKVPDRRGLKKRRQRSEGREGGEEKTSGKRGWGLSSEWALKEWGTGVRAGEPTLGREESRKGLKCLAHKKGVWERRREDRLKNLFLGKREWGKRGLGCQREAALGKLAYRRGKQ